MGRPLSRDAYEFRCGGPTGSNRRCGKKVGTAYRTEWGILEFEGVSNTPFDDDRLLRFNCPVHGDGVYYTYDLGNKKVVMVYVER